MPLIDPPWLAAARRDLGNAETLGPNDSPWIRRMWASLSGAWLLGQPWCGGAVASWMQQAGVAYPKAYYRARAWLDWGVDLTLPAVGCVVVFERVGGGHVGIVVGRDARGRLLVLGGNQGNAVSVAPFDLDRVAGYRWPAGRWAEHVAADLPVLAIAGASSRNEA